MKGLVLEFCIWAPLPHAPLQVVHSETSTTILLPPAAIFFLPVPLMRLWAFQIDSDITLEVRLLVCLLGLLALRSTPAMSLFTGYKKT